MSFFDDDQLNALTIQRMVFHLVGPAQDDYVRLEEINPGRFTSFFLERIRSIGGGAQYVFSDASATRERLHRIAQDPTVFQEESERLAEDFQRRHAGTTVAGAFLVFVLTAGEGEFFALLKYDDEQVLTYDMEEGQGGRKRATLDTIERTFVQNRNALQKAALVRLTEQGGELVVLDRKSPHKVARYFENFLDALRIYEDADLTEKLVKVTREVIRSNRDLVPNEVYSKVNQRTYEAASAGGAIDADNPQMFLESVMGQPLPDGHPIIKKYSSALKKARLNGTPILLNPAKVSRPRTRRYVTVNNIHVRVPIDVEDFVQVEPNRIIINDRVETQFDDTERAS